MEATSSSFGQREILTAYHAAVDGSPPSTPPFVAPLHERRRPPTVLVDLARALANRGCAACGSIRGTGDSPAWRMTSLQHAPTGSDGRHRPSAPSGLEKVSSGVRLGADLAALEGSRALVDHTCRACLSSAASATCGMDTRENSRRDDRRRGRRRPPAVGRVELRWALCLPELIADLGPTIDR